MLPTLTAVVNELANIASPLWDHIALVHGDMAYRADVELNSPYKPRLSKVVLAKSSLHVARLSLLHETLDGSSGSDIEMEEKSSLQVGCLPLCSQLRRKRQSNS
ncbi:hypothetical protein GN244_ATG13201 [Phytophthora infestans]|uniref:Uncharacterized protein n=1 Tax=Phytophthora infestans TaxID=4787 RepID=A0A833SLH1_PHYIN|nr:hypothetical protein GN244_ATG13201 [Phytophthora infestans]